MRHVRIIDARLGLRHGAPHRQSGSGAHAGQPAAVEIDAHEHDGRARRRAARVRVAEHGRRLDVEGERLPGRLKVLPVESELQPRGADGVARRAAVEARAGGGHGGDALGGRVLVEEAAARARVEARRHAAAGEVVERRQADVDERAAGHGPRLRRPAGRVGQRRDPSRRRTAGARSAGRSWVA